MGTGRPWAPSRRRHPELTPESVRPRLASIHEPGQPGANGLDREATRAPPRDGRADEGGLKRLRVLRKRYCRSLESTMARVRIRFDCEPPKPTPEFSMMNTPRCNSYVTKPDGGRMTQRPLSCEDWRQSRFTLWHEAAYEHLNLVRLWLRGRRSVRI